MAYDVDDGSVVHHCREDGAIALAHMLLDTIKQQDKDQQRREQELPELEAVTTDELLPCPICGSTSLEVVHAITETWEADVVECANCWAAIPLSRWNKNAKRS